MLQDGSSKMSKSAELDASRINLLDAPKLIQQKVKRAKTDTFDGLEFGNPDRPEATNLLGIYSLCTGISMVSCLSASAFHHNEQHFCFCLNICLAAFPSCLLSDAHRPACPFVQLP